MTEERRDEQKRTPRNTVRRPYSAPEVRKVQLKPEEMVLGACKTIGVCFGLVAEGS